MDFQSQLKNYFTIQLTGGFGTRNIIPPSILYHNFRLLGPTEAPLYNIPIAYNELKLLRIMDDLFEDDEDDEGGMSIDDFRLIGYLGCGSFGKIVLAKDQEVRKKLKS